MEEVHTTLKKHLEKEEEQLLPLFEKHFSCGEQASLVLQFLCCIPYSAITPMLKWLKRSVSKEQQEHLRNQVEDAASDSHLKIMVRKWLDPVRTDDVEVQPDTPDGSGEDFVCCGCSPCKSEDETQFGVRTEEDRVPLREIVYFHEAIRSAMSSFAEEAKALHDSSGAISPHQLQLLSERHKFIRSVCQFHSASEDAVLFPSLSRVVSSDGKSSGLLEHGCEHEHVQETARFEELGRLLGDVKSCARRGAKEVAKLTGELSEVSQKLCKSMCLHMNREETDVLPILCKSLCVAQQRHIVFKLVQAMPLRLLERFMPWIAASIPEDEANEWLSDIRKASSPSQKPLVELLCAWATRKQISGAERRHDPAAYPIKTCGMENFGTYNAGEDESIDFDLTGFPKPKRIRLDCQMNSTYDDAEMNSTPAKNEINNVHFGQRNPIDHIFQFHKALRQELKDLESAAVKLQRITADTSEEKISSDIGQQIQDLQTRFEFLRGIYRAHSRAEDEIVFPALESKETLHNVSHAYSLDHKQEELLFEDVSEVVSDIGNYLFDHDLEHLQIQTSKLSRMCAAVRASLETHVRAEEKELWPLFAEHFTRKEQEELVGLIIGQTGAEVLQVMLSWVTKSMTDDESDAMMESLKSASKATAFESWLGVAQASSSQQNDRFTGLSECSQSPSVAFHQEQKAVLAEVAAYLEHQASHEASTEKQSEPRSLDADSTLFRPGWEDIFRMSQKQLEVAVRRLSADDSLAPQRKAYLIQHLMASRYIVAQQKRNSVLNKNNSIVSTPRGEDSAQPMAFASKHPNSSLNQIMDPKITCFHNEKEGSLGCKHYSRKAMLIAPCCGKEYVCRLCHDEENLDHTLNRYSVKEMRCMICGTRQDISNSCQECGATMAHYYCSICHLFDDDSTKDIYHCQFCNFCRRGKGLGTDCFHCMSCNACMSLELMKKHKCKEAALSGTCPVCSDPLFESSTAIKELPCGHFMHSMCFSAYVRYSYTCPVCFKSLGDMEVFWRYIDAMLASEKLPTEYACRKQSIRCHDCGEASEAPFHFVYHKCGSCQGYNTYVTSSKD